MTESQLVLIGALLSLSIIAGLLAIAPSMIVIYTMCSFAYMAFALSTAKEIDDDDF